MTFFVKNQTLVVRDMKNMRNKNAK